MRHIIDLVVLVVLLAFIFTVAYLYRNPGECVIDPVLEKLRRDLIKVDPRLAKMQYYPSTESYTEDKEKIYICMKDEKGEYYPYNTLLAVALHEAAHALTLVVDKEHVTPEFNNMHNALRDKAAKLGLFNPDKPVQSNYCPTKN